MPTSKAKVEQDKQKRTYGAILDRALVGEDDPKLRTVIVRCFSIVNSHDHRIRVNTELNRAPHVDHRLHSNTHKGIGTGRGSASIWVNIRLKRLKRKNWELEGLSQPNRCSRVAALGHHPAGVFVDGHTFGVFEDGKGDPKRRQQESKHQSYQGKDTAFDGSKAGFQLDHLVEEVVHSVFVLPKTGISFHLDIVGGVHVVGHHDIWKVGSRKGLMLDQLIGL